MATYTAVREILGRIGIYIFYTIITMGSNREYEIDTYIFLYTNKSD